jgi:hypothetical protein
VLTGLVVEVRQSASPNVAAEMIQGVTGGIAAKSFLASVVLPERHVARAFR